MSTKRVTIDGPYRLEGVLRTNSPHGGVVVCHPHPLYGGNMYNNVVDAVEGGFSSKGFTTLKFNFRGVGESDGAYGEGKGEVEDLLAALDFLKERIDPDAMLWLAGYSFGAWICTMATTELKKLAGLLLVSYPFAFYPSDFLMRYNGDILLIGGQFDDIGPVDGLMEVYKAMPSVRKSIKIIPTDHFYWGKENEITNFIREVVPSPLP